MSTTTTGSAIEDAWLAEWSAGYAQGWAEALTAIGRDLTEALDGALAHRGTVDGMYDL